MTENQNTCSRQCANCRWAMEMEERYDQVHCCNVASPQAWSDVEATGCCEHFVLYTELQDEKRYDIEMNDGTIVKNVEYWAFGGGFQPSAKHMGTSHLVEYPLKDVASYSLANRG